MLHGFLPSLTLTITITYRHTGTLVHQLHPPALLLHIIINHQQAASVVDIIVLISTPSPPDLIN